jgi:hypothetical protein
MATLQIGLGEWWDNRSFGKIHDSRFHENDLFRTLNRLPRRNTYPVGAEDRPARDAVLWKGDSVSAEGIVPSAQL